MSFWSNHVKVETLFVLGEYRDDGRWSGIGENAREVFEDVVLSLTQVIGKIEVMILILILSQSCENMAGYFQVKYPNKDSGSSASGGVSSFSYKSFFYRTHFNLSSEIVDQLCQ